MAEPRKAEVVPLAEARSRKPRRKGRRASTLAASFEERVKALEDDVDQALAATGSGPGAERSVAEAFESVLEGYARLARSIGSAHPIEAAAKLVAGRRVPQVDPFGHDRA